MSDQWNTDAFSLDELSLMPCEMCGCTGYLMENGYGSKAWVECCDDEECGARGPSASIWGIDGPRDERFVRAERLSIQRWNEMQAYIARGKLLDEPTTNKRSKSL